MVDPATTKFKTLNKSRCSPIKLGHMSIGGCYDTTPLDLTIPPPPRKLKPPKVRFSDVGRVKSRTTYLKTKDSSRLDSKLFERNFARVKTPNRFSRGELCTMSLHEDDSPLGVDVEHAKCVPRPLLKRAVSGDYVAPIQTEKHGYWGVLEEGEEDWFTQNGAEVTNQLMDGSLDWTAIDMGQPLDFEIGSALSGSHGEWTQEDDVEQVYRCVRKGDSCRVAEADILGIACCGLNECAHIAHGHLGALTPAAQAYLRRQKKRVGSTKDSSSDKGKEKKPSSEKVLTGIPINYRKCNLEHCGSIHLHWVLCRESGEDYTVFTSYKPAPLFDSALESIALNDDSDVERDEGGGGGSPSGDERIGGVVPHVTHITGTPDASAKNVVRVEHFSSPVECEVPAHTVHSVGSDVSGVDADCDSSFYIRHLLDLSKLFITVASFVSLACGAAVIGTAVLVFYPGLRLLLSPNFGMLVVGAWAIYNSLWIVPWLWSIYNDLKMEPYQASRAWYAIPLPVAVSKRYFSRDFVSRQVWIGRRNTIASIQLLGVELQQGFSALWYGKQTASYFSLCNTLSLLDESAVQLSPLIVKMVLKRCRVNNLSKKSVGAIMPGIIADTQAALVSLRSAAIAFNVRGGAESSDKRTQDFEKVKCKYSDWGLRPSDITVGGVTDAVIPSPNDGLTIISYDWLINELGDKLNLYTCALSTLYVMSCAEIERTSVCVPRSN